MRKKKAGAAEPNQEHKDSRPSRAEAGQGKPTEVQVLQSLH